MARLPKRERLKPDGWWLSTSDGWMIGLANYHSNSALFRPAYSLGSMLVFAEKRWNVDIHCGKRLVAVVCETLCEALESETKGKSNVE
jgi:hypothetical protein